MKGEFVNTCMEAYTRDGAIRCAEILQSHHPDCAIRITEALIPNESGLFDKGFIVFPFTDDVPF